MFYYKITKLHVLGNAGHHQVFIQKIVSCKSVHIKHAAAYRRSDLIIEGFELNIAYSLSVEPSGCGVGLWAVWSKLGGRCIVGQYPSDAPVASVTAG